MDKEKVIESIKSSICSNVELKELGINEYLIHTRLTYSDGDELRIVLKQKKDQSWILTDEGHTVMWLSYDDYNMTPSRQDLFNKIITQNNVCQDKGCIFVSVTLENIGPAIYSLAQAILQIADLTYLDHKRVASTFLEDMKVAFKKSKVGSSINFELDKNIKFGNEVHHIDVYVEGSRPILIFGISNTNRCKDAIITMLALKEDRKNYTYVVVMDADAQISKREEQMAANRSDKTIYGIDAVPEGVDRIMEVLNPLEIST